MSKEQRTQDQNLMLGDRINWPFILASSVLRFQEAIVKVEGEQSEQEVREAALFLRALIPDQWIKGDEAWEKELKEIVTTTEVDTRKEWCGKKVGPPKYVLKEDVDPYKLGHACVNMFHRRGLLSKTIFTEKIVPDPEDFEEQKEDEP